VVELEAGKPTSEIGRVLAVCAAVGLAITTAGVAIRSYGEGGVEGHFPRGMALPATVAKGTRKDRGRGGGKSARFGVAAAREVGGRPSGRWAGGRCPFASLIRLLSRPWHVVAAPAARGRLSNNVSHHPRRISIQTVSAEGVSVRLLLPVRRARCPMDRENWW
jgi:hypothetical protein